MCQLACHPEVAGEGGGEREVDLVDAMNNDELGVSPRQRGGRRRGGGGFRGAAESNMCILARHHTPTYHEHSAGSPPPLPPFATSRQSSRISQQA